MTPRGRNHCAVWEGGMRRVLAVIAGIGVAVAATLFVRAAAVAQGQEFAALDSTFGTDGKVTTSLGTTDDRAFALARQVDGKIVMVGRSGAGNAGVFAVVRYNPDGDLDDTFDGDSGTGNGIVTTSVGSDGADGDQMGDEAHAVVIQPDGKIVVAGLADNAFPAFEDFAVVRYNADGTLDTTFSGDGKAFAHVDLDVAWGLALQSDGKIVVVGETGAGEADPLVVRFNADGTLDTSFNPCGTPPCGGKVRTNVVPNVGAGRADQFHAVAVQADGKIVAAGFAEVHPDGGLQADRDFAVVRYDADGSLDTTFGVGGIVTTPVSTDGTNRNDEANAVLIDADGKIVAAGVANMPHNSALFTENASDDFALLRYNSDGTLDTTFAADGTIVTSVSPIFGADRAWVVGLQADGKLVAAGVARDGTPDSSSREFAAARYNVDGSLDPTFNGDGKVTTPIAPHPEDDTGRAVALLPDGIGRAHV